MSKQPEWTGERLETFVHNDTTTEHLHRYALCMELVAGKIVLDLACGEGYGTNLLGAKAQWVKGVDIDQQTIEKAIANYNRNNISFEKADAVQIPSASHEFDVVVSFETLEHVLNQEQMMDEVKRVIKPGGLLIISTPNKKKYTDELGYQNPFHLKELYAAEFLELLRARFRYVKVYHQQITHSSVIYSMEANGLDKFSGNFSAIEKNKTDEPLYFIALASDVELPLLNNSIFAGDSIVQQALLEREKMVTGTITYRLGHIILYPFKLIRNLFNSNK